jgi:hypothetical protein
MPGIRQQRHRSAAQPGDNLTHNKAKIKRYRQRKARTALCGRIGGVVMVATAMPLVVPVSMIVTGAHICKSFASNRCIYAAVQQESSRLGSTKIKIFLTTNQHHAVFLRIWADNWNQLSLVSVEPLFLPRPVNNPSHPPV